MSLEAALAANTQALNTLLAHLQAHPIVPATQAPVAQAPVAQAPAVEPAPKAAKPKPKAEPVVEPPAVAAPPARTVSREEVAALVSRCLNLNARDAVRAAFSKFGAERFSEVKEADYARLADVLVGIAAEAAEAN